MHVRQLILTDFRSYASAEVEFGPGTTTLIGLNGQGKTNVVEAIGYAATLGSHRVATDQPLVRFGAARATISLAVVRDGRESLIDLELNPGRANRARLNRSPVPRPREILGTVRTVLFAPEDLALVKGDPGERRRFLDDLLVQRQPRWVAVRSEYERILKQRNALLKSARPIWSGRRRVARADGAGRSTRAEDPQVSTARESATHTLDVWDAQLAGVGAQLLYARLRLLRDLSPLLAAAYAQVSSSAGAAAMSYRSSLGGGTGEGLGEGLAARVAAGEVPEASELERELAATLAGLRDQEFERGVTLAGPHRDDVVLSLGELPAKGYASHGESWSLALGLRLAAYELLRRDLGDDPVLVLDDVFAELDVQRREKLAELVADCEQVIVTAAVPADVPEVLAARSVSYTVTLGEVCRGT